MRETDIGLDEFLFHVVKVGSEGGRVKRGLGVAGAEVGVGALAQVIGVAGRNANILRVNVILVGPFANNVFELAVLEVGGERQVTAVPNRGSRSFSESRKSPDMSQPAALRIPW